MAFMLWKKKKKEEVKIECPPSDGWAIVHKDKILSAPLAYQPWSLVNLFDKAHFLDIPEIVVGTSNVLVVYEKELVF